MDRINPDKLWSIEGEAGALGSMIIDSKCIGDILPLLDEKSFFKSEHQMIYNALIALFVESVPIDAIALRTELKVQNKLEFIGGVNYIAKLMQSVPSSANALYYAGVVKDRQRYRELISTIEQIKNVLAEPLNVDEQIEQMQSLALSLQQNNQRKEFYTFGDCAKEDSQPEKIYKTSLRNVNNIVIGFTPGELIILAGRPSMGKSALALQDTVCLAQAGLSVVYFTLEMTHKGLFERALRNANVQELEGLDVVLHENADTPDKQLAFVKTRKQTHGVDIVFVDYLQLMSCGRKSNNRVSEVSEISRKLKRMAMTEQVPVVALSQLNRQVESRDKHRPRLSDLRESGAIEQDADLVMLLHREDVYRLQEDPGAPQDGSAELIIAKNRRGKTGIASLVFIDERVCFGDKVHFAKSLI